MNWYRKKNGRTIDLPGSIYELVQIVHVVVGGGQGRYRIDDRRTTQWRPWSRDSGPMRRLP